MKRKSRDGLTVIPSGPVRFGLVLGGGGARGIAHVGVLKVLEQARIIPDIITGTSIGALVGAAYACRPDARALEKRINEVLDADRQEARNLKILEYVNWEDNQKSDPLSRLLRYIRKEMFLNLMMWKDAVLSEQELRALVAAFLPDIDLTETVLCFAAVAVDLATGSKVVLTRGSIIDAVMASCAVPGYMTPVRLNGRILVDGGVADPLPVEVARAAGAQAVVAVDVTGRVCRLYQIPDGIDVINRAMEIMGHHLSNDACNRSDLVIQPITGCVDWTAFQSYKDLVRLGEVATESELDAIRRLLQANSKLGWLPAVSVLTRVLSAIRLL